MLRGFWILGLPPILNAQGVAKMIVGCRSKSAAGVFDSGVEAGEEVGFAVKGFGAETFGVGCIKVEFVAIDHEGDPAEHAGDKGGEIAEFH